MVFVVLGLLLVLVGPFRFIYNRYLTTATVAGLVARSRADLRQLQMALRAYYAEHRKFPNDLAELVTSGVCTSLPCDPFRAGSVSSFSYDPKSSPVIVYSWGPDGEDNRGAIEYDPTNGVRSIGDIICRVSYP